MYRKKDELQALVNTLSATEKRAFFAFANKYPKAEKAIYVQLFEGLTKGKEPKMSASSPQAMVIAKRSLYRNILKSLREFHQNKPDAQLQNMLSEVEILYDKNLPGQSMRILQRAKQEAYKAEKFGIILQILEWERKLIAFIDAPPRPVTVIAEEEREVAGKLNQIFELERLHAKAIEYKRKYGYVRGEAIARLQEDILDMDSLKQVQSCLSQKALYYFHYTRSLCHFMIFDYAAAYNASRQLIAMDAALIPLHDYLNAILLHTTSCICSGYFDETLDFLHKAQVLINSKQIDLMNILSLKVFYYKSNYEMICCLYKGDITAVKRIVKAVEESLSRFQDRIPVEMKCVINIGLRNAYFSMGATKEVDRMIDAAMGKEMKWVRNDIYDDTLLFRLFWLIDGGCYEILPSAALSTYRYFSGYNQTDNRYDFELTISRYLQKEQDFRDKKVLRGALEYLAQVLRQHVENINPASAFLEHYSYYLIWIDSMLEGITFAAAARTWFAGRGAGAGQPGGA